jgi:polysaccharide export outer membrane protein
MVMKRLFSRLNDMVFPYRFLGTISLSLTLITVGWITGCQSQLGTNGATTPGGSAAASQAGSSAYSPRSPGYLIGPEDVLHISVWKEEELDREVLVRPDGGISFPLAGNMQAAGKTTEELMTEITRRIQRYIPDAVVTVTVSKVSGYDIFVIGKVNKPGQFTLGQYVDVLQALTLAGGLTPFASEDDIRIQRRENGQLKVYPFEYSEIKKGRNLEQNIILNSGDVVVVP